MPSDIELLEELNRQIGAAESAGDRAWLSRVVAPTLAFLRADGQTFDDAEQFLQKVAATDPRTTSVESVELFGNRAIVKCVVTVTSGATQISFHNLRLFVRFEGRWCLLGWANEKMGSS